MFKRGISAISIIVVMLMTSSAIAQFSGPRFFDVQPDDYFYESAGRFSRKGIIKGHPDGRFAPHDYVTRGQTSVIMDRYDQIVIQRLRQQVDAMRLELGLGQCGDNVQQVGEECDDGNVVDNDGCSKECISEVHCSGGYKLGERFSATDGCNVCTCTQSGIACTSQVCTEKKCFSSQECSSGEVCTTEQGDCRYPCPAGAVCIQACAGVCVPSLATAECGNSICEDGESAFPSKTGTELYCPQDCKATGPVCGNNICEDGETDEYALGDLGPELLRKGTCPADCEGGLSSCDQQKKSIDTLFDNSLQCQSDSDCAVFVRGCSPYLTCGKPIRKDALDQLSNTVEQYVDACGSAEPTLCAGCIEQSVSCMNGTCVLIE